MRDIAELFLIGFIERILEIKAPNNPIIQVQKNENYNIMQSSIMKQQNIERKIEIPKFNTQQKVPQKPIQNIIKKPAIQRPKINYSVQPTLSATEKLNTLIRDPYVNEIECNGVENPLSVRKSGMIQNTNINLSIEEIYDIIAEFSQKTRIPVISGRIKAALNDLVITAVLSETLGPRFIIQKKKPFQELII